MDEGSSPDVRSDRRGRSKRPVPPETHVTGLGFVALGGLLVDQEDGALSIPRLGTVEREPARELEPRKER